MSAAAGSPAGRRPGPAPGGVLLLDKPAGPTSHDAVDAVRRALGTRRVGHFGTLDPFASGLLVLGVGPATRLAFAAGDHEKEYDVGVRLGWRSATDDPDGERTPVEGAAPPEDAAVRRTCRAWMGEVLQAPPTYSAKHVGGRRAYAIARAGGEVELPPVPVVIRSIEVRRFDYPDLDLCVVCGAGAYMRALARDLGEALGTGGYCARLRRLRSGPFRVEEALAWAELGDPGRAAGALLPAETLVAGLPAAELDLEGQRAAVQGRALPLPAGVPAEAEWVRLRGPAGFFGLAEVGDSAQGPVLRPRRILVAAEGP